MNRTNLTAILAGAALVTTAGLGAQQSSSPTPITIVPITPISPSSPSAPPAMPPAAPASSQPVPPFQPGGMPPSTPPPAATTPMSSGMMPSTPAPGPVTSAPVPAAPVERVLNLTFNADGTVSLLAKGVAARDVLVEWKRKCGCTVINAEKMTGGLLPVPVQFDAMPQRTVLDALLRQAAGYTLTPRRPNTTSVSNYETIYILASSSPTASTSTYSGAPMPAPYATPGSPDDELPPVTPMVPPPQTPVAPPARPPAGPQQPGVFVPIVPITPGPATPPGGRGAPPLPGGRGGGFQ
jgi:hypothetical protein